MHKILELKERFSNWMRSDELLTAGKNSSQTFLAQHIFLVGFCPNFLARQQENFPSRYINHVRIYSETAGDAWQNGGTPK